MSKKPLSWLSRLARDGRSAEELLALKPYLAGCTDADAAETLEREIDQRLGAIAVGLVPEWRGRFSSSEFQRYAAQMQRAGTVDEVLAIEQRVQLRYPGHPRVAEIEALCSHRREELRRYARKPQERSAADTVPPTLSLGVSSRREL